MKITTKPLIFLIFFWICYNLNGQDLISIPDTLLVSNSSFNKTIKSDISYLLISDQSLAQGASLTKNDEGSQITFTGNLINVGRVVINAEASFKSSNGIYFFDNDNGESAKISLGIYFGWDVLYKFRSRSNGRVHS